MEEFYENISQLNNKQILIIMNCIDDMSLRCVHYGFQAEEIELVNVYGNPLEKISFLKKIRDKTSPILNKLHNLFLENYD